MREGGGGGHLGRDEERWIEGGIWILGKWRHALPRLLGEQSNELLLGQRHRCRNYLLRCGRGNTILRYAWHVGRQRLYKREQEGGWRRT